MRCHAVPRVQGAEGAEGPGRRGCRVQGACLGGVGESDLAAIERQLEVGGALLAVLLVLGVAEEHVRRARRPPVHHAGRHRAEIVLVVFGDLAEGVEQVGLRCGHPRKRSRPRCDASDGHEALARGREECEHGAAARRRRRPARAIRKHRNCEEATANRRGRKDKITYQNSKPCKRG
eukprot:scaffold36396_cov63-Phaeocystis_antarctica.AAC.3